MSWNTSRRLVGAGAATTLSAALLAVAAPGASSISFSGSAGASHVQRVAAVGSAHFSAARVASRLDEAGGQVVMASELKIPRGAKSRSDGKAPSSATTADGTDPVTDATPSG